MHIRDYGQIVRGKSGAGWAQFQPARRAAVRQEIHAGGDCRVGAVWARAVPPTLSTPATAISSSCGSTAGVDVIMPIRSAH
jgi:hypothetical protein